MAGLDWEKQEKARNYVGIMRPLAFLEIGIVALFILVLLLNPISTSMRKLLDFIQLFKGGTQLHNHCILFRDSVRTSKLL
jgi:hypothetical protein